MTSGQSVKIGICYDPVKITNGYPDFLTIAALASLLHGAKPNAEILYPILRESITNQKNYKKNVNFLESLGITTSLVEKRRDDFVNWQRKCDYCLFSGRIGGDRFILDNRDISTRWFTYGMTTNCQKFSDMGKALEFMFQLWNMSFTEEKQARNFNSSYLGTRPLLFCEHVLQPALVADMKEILERFREDIDDNVQTCKLIDTVNTIAFDESDGSPYNMNWGEDRYGKVISRLLKCKKILTTNFNMFCIGLSLGKELQFVGKDDYRFLDLKRVLGIKVDEQGNVINIDETLSKLEQKKSKSMEYIRDTLDFNRRFSPERKYDDVEMLEGVKREDTLSEILKRNEYKIYLNGLGREFVEPENREHVDVALVTAFYGERKECVDAAKLALELTYRNANPLPKDWIFIEAQEDESKCQFKEIAEKYGIRHVFKKIEGCYSREFYFNLGAKFTKLDKIVFMDSDASCVESDWIGTICRTLDKYDIIMPFKYFYRSNEFSITAQIIKPATCLVTNVADRNFKKHYLKGIDGFPGIGIGITRRMFNAIGGLLVSPSTAGDTPFLRMIIPWYHQNAMLFELYNMARDTYMNGITKRLACIDGINPHIFYADNICFHINHGNVGLRSNRGHSVFSRRLNDRLYQDIVMDEDEIHWNLSDDAGILHAKCLKEFNESYMNANLEKYQDSNIFVPHEDRKQWDELAQFFQKINGESVKIASDILVKNLKELYGSIDVEHPLNVVVVPDKVKYGNSKCSKALAQWNCAFKQMGRGCVNPILMHDKDFPRHLPIEMRKLLVTTMFKDENTLVLSPNIQPTKTIDLPRCKQNTFNMPYNDPDFGQKCTWNPDMIYFNGDYSFMYEEFMELPNDLKNIGLSEFVLHSLLNRGKQITGIQKYLVLDLMGGTPTWKMRIEYYNCKGI